MGTNMVTKTLIFIYLVLFPFGQLPAMLVGMMLDLGFRIHFADIMVVLIGFTVLFQRFRTKRHFPLWTTKGIEFAIFGAAVFLISPHYLGFPFEPLGIFYAIRIIGYVFLSLAIFKSSISKDLLADSLILIAVFIGIFGTIQYLWIPDLTAMKFSGWDDHYFRMVGSFIDPAFFGILLSLGILTAVWRNKPFYSVLLVLPLALSYSRASWLALAVGLGVYVMRKFKPKLSIFILLFLSFIIFSLPNPGGEGVNLQRTNSIYQKIDNYHQSLLIIEKSPVFGVGLNSLCDFKGKDPFVDQAGNSCYGLDNSILFIIATTGLLGLFIFVGFILEIFKSTESNYKVVLLSSFLSIFVHGMFTQTFFYPWVMGWVAILVGISRKSGGVRKS